MAGLAGHGAGFAARMADVLGRASGVERREGLLLRASHRTGYAGHEMPGGPVVYSFAGGASATAASVVSSRNVSVSWR